MSPSMMEMRLFVLKRHGMRREHPHANVGFSKRHGAQRCCEGAKLDLKVVFQIFIQTRPLHSTFCARLQFVKSASGPSTWQVVLRGCIHCVNTVRSFGKRAYRYGHTLIERSALQRRFDPTRQHEHHPLEQCGRIPSPHGGERCIVERGSRGCCFITVTVKRRTQY